MVPDDFFSLSFDIMCVLDAQGGLTRVNPAFENVLGYTQDKTLLQTLIHYVHPEDTSFVAAALDAAITSHAAYSFAARFRCTDDSHKWLFWTLTPQPQGLIYAVARDITPLKQIEETEAERNILAEALLDTVYAINSSLSLDQVLKRILSNIGKVVAYTYVYVILIEEEYAYIAGHQSMVPSQHMEKLIPSVRLHVNERHYLHMMATTGNTVIVSDIQQDPKWKSVPGFDLSGAYIGTPIIVEEEVIGFLNVINAKRDFFTRLHAQQLKTFASHVGIAIQNARLYEQAQTAAVLEERQRLARELHDSVNQNLFAAIGLADLIPKAFVKKPEKVVSYAADISQLTRGALAQMRMILLELYPEALVKTPLQDLLQYLCNALTGSTSVVVNFVSTGNVLLSEESQLAYYRIAQEALHNIETHADATRVSVKLTQYDDEITLVIHDNGRGFDLDTIPAGHFGIKNMQDRAEHIGAELEITTTMEAGTTVILRGRNNVCQQPHPGDPD